MKKIQIDKIEDGMILAKPLMGTAGNVLLSEGLVLKTAMIARLRNWGIQIVTIESNEAPSETETVSPGLEHKPTELDDVFSDVLKNPIMKIIYDSTKAYLAGDHK